MDKTHQDSNTNLKSEPATVLFVPGDLFWAKRFVTPEMLKKEAVEAFCLTQLEMSAPLGVEQLLWGKCVYGQEILIFATIKDRIETLFPNYKEFLYVLPSFMAVDLKRRTPSHQALFVQDGESLSLIVWEPQETAKPEDEDDERHDLFSKLPLSITSCHLSKDATAESILDAKESLIKQATRHGCSLPSTPLIPLRQINAYHLSLNQKALFVKQTLDQQTFTETIVGHKPFPLWHSDIREQTFLKKLMRQVKMKSFYWNAFLIGLLSLFFLLGGTFLQWIAAFQVQKMQKTIARQAPEVEEMTQKHRVTKLFKHILEPSPKPLEQLGLLNTLRPSNLYFTSVEMDTHTHHFVIQGVAENANAINLYQAALAKEKTITNVQFSKLQVSNRGTQFHLNCAFLFKQTKKAISAGKTSTPPLKHPKAT